MSKERKWRLTLTEPQLRLIARCVEDCSRFARGQTMLDNTTKYLRNSPSIREVLLTVSPMVNPYIGWGAIYGWDGANCPHERQRGFITKTHYLYREILHQLTVEHNKEGNMSWDDVLYMSETLRCAESGEPIKLEVVNETDQD